MLRTVSERSWYDVLGVEPSAAPEDLKRAYRRRVMQLHPDRRAGQPRSQVLAAQRQLQLLNEAWAVLRDPGRRARYDAGRSAAGWAAGRTADTPSEPSPVGDDPTGIVAELLRRGFALATAAPPWYWRRPTGTGGLQLTIGAARTLAPLRLLAPDGLRGLRADDEWVGDADLAHLSVLTGLRALDLSGSSVTDEGLRHLSGLHALDDLQLWGTRTTDAGVALLAGLPSLSQLNLGETAISDDGLEALVALRRLRFVNLRRTAVTSGGLARLLALPALEMVAVPWHVRGRGRRRLQRLRPELALV